MKSIYPRPFHFVFILVLVCTSIGAAGASELRKTAYQSPLPGAHFVSRDTRILVRMKRGIDTPPDQLQSEWNVRGSKSGDHRGISILSDDGTSVIFAPHSPFVEGEIVNVATGNRDGRSTSVLPITSFSFTIGFAAHPGGPQKLFAGELTDEAGPAVSYPPARALTDTIPLDFPYVASTVLDSTAPGKLFLSNLSFTGSVVPYLMILQNSVAPVFYRKMPQVCTDFKMQPNGLLTYFQTGVNKVFAMDSSYNVVDSFVAGNGYTTDIHEVRLLPNGHALLMAYDSQFVDMSAITPGGNPSATVIGLIIQELDQQKNVVFEWRSWDHFQITDATHENLTSASIDYVHGNAIELDTDGNLMISSRHMDEITKIDRQTGDVLWRLGGKNNEFTFVNDSIQFSHQHGIRRLANGNVILYDNGNFHSPQFSRAVEYALDEQTKTATLVWQYRHAPDIYGQAMGYAQRLDNGNTLVGWGAANPSVTEVRPDGSVVYELTLAAGIFSYRAYRFPWKEGNADPIETKPEQLSLFQNYPNPFNTVTRILVSISEATTVSFNIYDVLGRLVETKLHHELKNPGTYFVVFDGSTLSSGTYFYRLTTDRSDQIRKMQLIR